ncbi:hypothetical protein CLAFUW4_02498 [Fulvia fulva]|uniref:Uncharacterized protein n=1 Tax=Passalora fulva TaxID=5499 RepID=A0A9Q8LDB7_PASFU|nr:uncharacterized protein CLAFUR5_02488 [Fulvia fulva]KAK4632379.1 hypothetical protein CLAFUR4_02493 [Fulvia fulva]KAK4632936.1 hypothetical protein CLAFUR0_02497 [Fulvia fulva]UJO14603.1 hypothetical protein CLAFUR5_02488 [Fulvia fulva]WPV10441.1 hypothetical protein CLAFUW4_02498 [Fulvia fulva]WPV25836.1 hypothetical protein CLAFUW7_02498 [Fulvia fulva]
MPRYLKDLKGLSSKENKTQTTAPKTTQAIINTTTSTTLPASSAPTDQLQYLRYSLPSSTLKPPAKMQLTTMNACDRKIYTGCEIQRKIYTGCEVQKKIYTGCTVQKKIYTGCTVN